MLNVNIKKILYKQQRINIRAFKNKYQSLTEDKKQKIKDYQKEYQKEYKKNISNEQKQKLKDYRKEYYKKYMPKKS